MAKRRTYFGIGRAYRMGWVFLTLIQTMVLRCYLACDAVNGCLWFERPGSWSQAASGVVPGLHVYDTSSQSLPPLRRWGSHLIGGRQAVVQLTQILAGKVYVALRHRRGAVTKDSLK